MRVKNNALRRALSHRFLIVKPHYPLTYITVGSPTQQAQNQARFLLLVVTLLSSLPPWSRQVSKVGIDKKVVDAQ
jgi:hypothetical protein